MWGGVFAIPVWAGVNAGLAGVIEPVLAGALNIE
jgi:hypothetical protein